MITKKLIVKLEELKKSLIILKNEPHSKGEEEFEAYREILKRIIDRIYPEKDAKEFKDKLIHKNWIIDKNTITDEEYWQKFYLTKINKSIKVINTILEEFKIFESDNFHPIKQKIETEIQIGSNKLGFWKRRKSKEGKI